MILFLVSLAKSILFSSLYPKIVTSAILASNFFFRMLAIFIGQQKQQKNSYWKLREIITNNNINSHFGNFNYSTLSEWKFDRAVKQILYSSTVLMVSNEPTRHTLTNKNYKFEQSKTDYVIWCTPPQMRAPSLMDYGKKGAPGREKRNFLSKYETNNEKTFSMRCEKCYSVFF